MFYFPSPLPLLFLPFSHTPYLSLPLCLGFFLSSYPIACDNRFRFVSGVVCSNAAAAHHLSRVSHDTLVHIALSTAGRVRPLCVRCKNRLWSGAPATVLPERVLLVASAGSSKPATSPTPPVGRRRRRPRQYDSVSRTCERGGGKRKREREG